MRGISSFGMFLFCLALYAQDIDVYIDTRDGEVYKTVQIGEQLWMADNLKFSSEDSRAIYSKSTMLSEVFGKLYCWEMALEVCPDGWHLPSDEEWLTLADHLGGEDVAGGKMKEISKYWNSLDEESNNESGFSALPGGFLEDPKDTSYPYMGEMGFFWSSKEKSRSEAWFRYVKYDGNLLKAGNGDKVFGMSVRCLKD